MLYIQPVSCDEAALRPRLHCSAEAPFQLNNAGRKGGIGGLLRVRKGNDS